VAHYLIVGGTGMLKQVSLELVRAGNVVTIVARRHSKMDLLIREAGPHSENINPILIDYSKTAEFLAQIAQAIQKHGEISKAVIWIHSYANESVYSLAHILTTSKQPCDFLHIRGSESLSAADADPLAESLRLIPNLNYRELLLGFVATSTGNRWLTDDEIAGGVLAALSSQEGRVEVGQLLRIGHRFAVRQQ
jgi:hypothetical protein